LPFIHRSSRFSKPETCVSCDLTIAIKPEKWWETNWTKVSIDASSDGVINRRQEARPRRECRQTNTKV
jgi:hypothetical protein